MEADGARRRVRLRFLRLARGTDADVGLPERLHHLLERGEELSVVARRVDLRRDAVADRVPVDAVEARVVVLLTDRLPRGEEDLAALLEGQRGRGLRRRGRRSG